MERRLSAARRRIDDCPTSLAAAQQRIDNRLAPCRRRNVQRCPAALPRPPSIHVDTCTHACAHTSSPAVTPSGCSARSCCTSAASPTLAAQCNSSRPSCRRRRHKRGERRTVTCVRSPRVGVAWRASSVARASAGFSSSSARTSSARPSCINWCGSVRFPASVIVLQDPTTRQRHGARTPLCTNNGRTCEKITQGHHTAKRVTLTAQAKSQHRQAETQSGLQCFASKCKCATKRQVHFATANNFRRSHIHESKNWASTDTSTHIGSQLHTNSQTLAQRFDALRGHKRGGAFDLTLRRRDGQTHTHIRAPAPTHSKRPLSRR
jgi:hypothetical protein